MSNKKKFFGINDENWGHKWGYKDSSFVIEDDKSVTFSGDRYPVCGKKLTSFIPFVESVLEVEIQKEPKVIELEEKYVEEAKINQLDLSILELVQNKIQLLKDIFLKEIDLKLGKKQL